MSGPNDPQEMEGLVGAAYARRCLVLSEGREWECAVGGRLLRKGSLVAGDRVRFLPGAEGLGTIREVHPRSTVLERPQVGRERSSNARFGRSVSLQPLAANVDQLVVVSSLHEPPFRVGLVERILVAAARADLLPLIHITKLDLDTDDAFRGWQEHFAGLNIPVLGSDIFHPETLAPLKEALVGKISVLVGHSGVGKTTILNAIAGTTLAVGEVAPYHQRGRHTTSTARLVPLPDGGWVIDSPGIREFGLSGVAAADLARYFPGMEPFLGECAFRDCCHRTESGCSVRAAVADGRYPAERYDGYLKLLEEVSGVSGRR